MTSPCETSHAPLFSRIETCIPNYLSPMANQPLGFLGAELHNKRNGPTTGLIIQFEFSMCLAIAYVGPHACFLLVKVRQNGIWKNSYIILSNM